MNISHFSAILTLASLAAAPAAAQSLMAQNTYGSGTVSSQDSILSDSPQNYQAQNTEIARHDEVLAAETNLNFSGSFLHTQYHENAPPGTGDDENGFTEGFGVGIGALLPHLLIWPNVDLYSTLDYQFSAGNIAYGGHYLISGLPSHATDRAVFNRVEARFGLGFPLLFGAEAIPFIAGGFQSWNRNIENTGQIGTDEDYTSGLIGAGVKLDLPLTSALVASGSAELLDLFAGNVALNNVPVSHGLGGSAEEALGFGLNYRILGRFHAFTGLDWEHFNYAGNKPTLSTYSPYCGCEYYEPLSTTTQFGANLGLAYSF